MRTMRMTGAFLATLLLLAGLAKAQGGYHVDNTYGYKIKAPAKWNRIPIKIDEKWIIAKYLSHRTYQPKKSQFFVDHAPEMRVIIFTEDATKIRRAKVEREGNRVTVQRGSVPYRDYKDYLRRNFSSGGFHFSKEKEGQAVSKMRVDKYEVKFEKLTGAPRRRVTWVFHAEDAMYAVEFEFLEDHARKLAPMATRSLKSFRFIERDAANVRGGTTGAGKVTTPPWTRDRDGWKKLSAAERKKQRKAIEKLRMDRATREVPEGWLVKKTRHYLILSHADAKFTRRAADAAEACRSWLEKYLGDVTDEYVMGATIRVCADYNEYRSYVRGSGDAWSIHGREIVFYKDSSQGDKKAFDRLLRALTRQFLYDKDNVLYMYLPPWLEHGLYDVMGSAKVNGKKLVFKADTWENEAIREGKREGRLATARQLMEMLPEKFFSQQGMLNSYQAARLVRYFLGKKKAKEFLVEYMREVIVAGEATKGSRTVIAAAETEEEEEARYAARNSDRKKRARAIIKHLGVTALALTEKEWQSIERGYAQELD